MSNLTKDPMTYLEAARKSEESAKALQQMLLDSHVFRGCWNCDYMNRDTNVCQRFKLQPPVQVITFGCRDWVMLIPF